MRRRHAGAAPHRGEVTKDLCVSPRTLQRRLEESGTTYQQLLDEVRQDTARKLLAATDLESGEIAFLLGFEELNSFTRAFHDWEGATPSRWRAASVGALKFVNGSRQVAK
jgi:AraC-like DNA-binding protein